MLPKLPFCSGCFALLGGELNSDWGGPGHEFFLWSSRNLSKNVALTIVSNFPLASILGACARTKNTEFKAGVQQEKSIMWKGNSQQ